MQSCSRKASYEWVGRGRRCSFLRCNIKTTCNFRRFMEEQHTKTSKQKSNKQKRWLKRTRIRISTQFCSSTKQTRRRHWAWSKRSWWTEESKADALDRVWKDCNSLLLATLTEGEYLCFSVSSYIWHCYISGGSSLRMRRHIRGQERLPALTLCEFRRYLSCFREHTAYCRWDLNV